jgi:methyl-accepting chemotaxis protein
MRAHSGLAIAEKISIVEDIACQMNLLALNAAMEAARPSVGRVLSVIAEANYVGLETIE